MCDEKNLELVAEASGVNFFISSSDSDSDRRFGIKAVATQDPTGSALAENLFFTKTEAEKCCLWLAENNVEPIILCEVLSNFYQF